MLLVGMPVACGARKAPNTCTYAARVHVRRHTRREHARRRDDALDGREHRLHEVPPRRAMQRRDRAFARGIRYVVHSIM